MPSENLYEDPEARFGDCVCFNTRRAARQLAQAYDRALQPSGLKNTQFTTLASISLLRGEPTISELAGSMGVERTTLTRNLELLARDGLVHIGQGADGRSKQVELTRAGREAFESAVPLWRRMQDQVAASVADWSRLAGELAKLAEAARGA